MNTSSLFNSANVITDLSGDPITSWNDLSYYHNCVVDGIEFVQRIDENILSGEWFYA